MSSMNIQPADISSTVEPSAPYGNNSAILSDKEFDQIIRLAVETFGTESQTQMLFEEMAELQEALCKLARGRDTRAHVCEEIADVLIMCLQMAQIYGPKAVENWINIKINRLKNRLDNPQYPQ